MNTSRRARLNLPVVCALFVSPAWGQRPATLAFEPPEDKPPSGPVPKTAATPPPANSPNLTPGKPNTAPSAAAPRSPSPSQPTPTALPAGDASTVTTRTDTTGSLVSPPSTITWRSPDHCPAPRARLDALLGEPFKHPLWGEVEVRETPPSWLARLRLSDTPDPTGAHSARAIEGNTCAEVTEAALLVISIMQREAPAEPPHQLAEPAPTAVTPVRSMPAIEQSQPKAAGPIKPAAAPQPRRKVEPTEAKWSTATSVGIGASWTLWNGKTPAIGGVAMAQHTWGPLSVRPQLGLSTFVNALPTTETAKVSLTSAEAGVDLCFALVSGLAGCAGPTLQYLVVEGEDVGTPTRSTAWFPGIAASLIGHHESAGLGLWGELGANLRFKEIVLDLNPVGEVASITRLGFYAWIGPQWRWR